MIVNEEKTITIVKKLKPQLPIDVNGPILTIEYEQEVGEYEVPLRLIISFKFDKDNIKLDKMEHNIPGFEFSYDKEYQELGDVHDIPTALDIRFAAEILDIEKAIGLALGKACDQPIEILNKTEDRDLRKKFIASMVIWYMTVHSISVDTLGEHKQFNAGNRNYGFPDIGAAILDYLIMYREPKKNRVFSSSRKNLIMEDKIDQILEELTTILIYRDTKFSDTFIHVNFGIKFGLNPNNTLTYDVYTKVLKASTPQQIMFDFYYSILDTLLHKIKRDMNGNEVDKHPDGRLNRLPDICEFYEVDPSIVISRVSEYILGSLGNMRFNIEDESLTLIENPDGYNTLMAIKHEPYRCKLPIGIVINSVSLDITTDDTDALYNLINNQ